MSRCIRDAHLAITPQALQGAPSYADNAWRVATGANTSPTSDQPSRRGDSRLVNNPTAAVPATASTTRPRTSRVRETGNPTDSSADIAPRPPTAVGSSQNSAALRTMSSRVSAPTAPITPQAAQKEGETRSDPILPSKSSIGQPSAATVPLVPPKGPYLGSPRTASNDPSSKLPEDPHHGNSDVPSVIQVDSPQGAVESKPQVKLSDSVGLTQPSGASSFAF